MRFFFVFGAFLAFQFFLISSAAGQAPATDSLQKADTAPARLEGLRKAFWDNLPRPAGWVNDFEGLFTVRQEKQLTSLILRFKKKTSVEMAVVTVYTTMSSAENFDALALRLHNAWGVGKKVKNNGILILISAGLKRIRISNGAGIMKVLSNSETQQIITGAFIPCFKEGDYFTGTLSGLHALMDQLTAHPLP